MLTFRSGGAQLIVANQGVQVWQPQADVPWWLAAGVTPVAAYAAKGAADLASSYINLANPGSNNAAPGVAPTFNTATGWTFNGSTQYLTTGIVPNNDQSWSAIVRFASATAANVYAFGLTQTATTRTLGIAPRYGDGNRYYNNGGELGIAGGVTSGVMAFAGNKAYNNGVAESGTIPTASGSFTVEIYIGALRVNATIGNFFGGSIQALWIAHSVLDAAGNLAMYNAMATL